jgi:hypothetical protein
MPTREGRDVLGRDVAGVAAVLAPDGADHADGEVDVRLRAGHADRRAAGTELADAHGHGHGRGRGEGPQAEAGHKASSEQSRCH